MGWCGTRSGLGLPSCFLSFRLYPCAWVGPVDLLLCDLIVHRCCPVGGGPLYFIVNAGSLTIKKKKKKKLDNDKPYLYR